MEFLGFVNLTPFAAEPFLLADERGGELLVLVAKATYRLDSTDRPVLDEAQVPLYPAGVFYGEPGKSSLKYAPECDFTKLTTDVVLIGHAHAPRGNPTTELDVTLRVGPVNKTVRVFGDRHWVDPGRWSQTKIGPRPFLTMPLVYERAFGGVDLTPAEPRRHEREPRNPVGVGLVARGTRLKGPVPLPNLENPEKLIRSPADRPDPAGFGFVSPDWKWRLQYAGTYDERWTKKRMPLLPEDFDRRFLNAASPDLIAPKYLRGGEPVIVVNASPRGRLAFALPTGQPEGVVMMKDRTRHQLAMNLDTVVVNTDEHRIFLLWRSSLPLYKKVYEVLWVKVQTVRAGAERRAA